MPDYQQFKMTVSGTASPTLPRVLIEARITDSSTGATLADFTGANAVVFPTDIGGFTQQQKIALVEKIAKYMMRIKACGLDPDTD